MNKTVALTVLVLLTILASSAMGKTSNLFVPLALPSGAADGTVFGQYASLHVQSFDEPLGYVPVYFPGDSGDADYRDSLNGGYDPITINIGDVLETHFAIAFQTFIWLQDRLLSETDPRFIYDPDDPKGSGTTAWDNWIMLADPVTGAYPRTWRIATMAVVETDSPSGAECVVVGFADFFLERAFGGDTTDSDGTFHAAGDIDGHFINGVLLEPVPEPASILILGSGILALAGFIRRKR